MADLVKIGIVGDYKPGHFSHVATEEAITHAAVHLSIGVEAVWLPTLSLAAPSIERVLEGFDGIWCGPGDYTSMQGALDAIRLAREREYPFLGT